MNRHIAGLLIACASTTAASAQCSFFRHGIPDFDQVRDGLPNMGNMYCVPTSAMNLLGYVANRGVPSVLDGPRNWQSNDNVSHVTDRLSFMGMLMATSPENGTGGNSAHFGLELYLLTTAPGKFSVSHYYGNYHTDTLVYHYMLGRLVNVCYGYYEVDSFGRYERDGGHCVTLAGILDFCESMPRIRFRDPGSGGSSTATQSSFANAHSDASPEFFVDTNNLIRQRTRLWDLGVGSTTRRYLDSYFTISPRVALTGSITNRDRFNIHFSFTMPGATPPPPSGVLPGGHPITDLILEPNQIDAFAITFQQSNHRYRLFRQNLATGKATEVLDSEAIMKIATSRFGDLFVSGDGSIRKYSFDENGAEVVQEVEIPGQVDAMTYDDLRDELVVITSNNRFLRLSHDLDAPRQDRALPPTVATLGDASLAIDEAAQKYYICGKDSPNIFMVGLAPSSERPVLEEQIVLPAIQKPERLQLTEEGTLILLNDGVIAEFARDGAGAWGPYKDSHFAGLPGAGGFVIGRSRTNFVAGVHDTSAWNNVLVDEGLTETPDCAADFNLDGAFNSQDLFDFLTAFFTNDAAADFNFDDTINSQDLFDFLGVFFNGCN